MKILFPIGAFFPSQIGGPCNTMYWHTNELSKNGVKVNIVTSTLGIEAGEVVENQEIKSISGSIFYGSGNYNSLNVLVRSLQQIRNSDILHFNSFFDLLSFGSFIFAKIFYPRKVIVWSVRGQLNPKALNFSKWKKKPLIFIYKKLSKGILFHTTSTAETEDTKRVFKKNRIIPLPNFIQPSERLSLSKKKKQVLFVGRIHPIKAVHKLVEALALSELFLKNDFKLVLAGIHEPRHQFYRDELDNLIDKYKLNKKVEFIGHVSGEEKEVLYAESLVLILPSETENFGNVVIEALNQGTPVIASKGTPWAILEKYNCGYHIDNSPRELAKALDDIIGLDDGEFQTKRKNAMKMIDDNFNISTKINDWIEVYSSSVNKEKTAG